MGSLRRWFVIGVTVLFCWGTFVLVAKFLLGISALALGGTPHLDVAAGMAVKLYGWVWYPLLAIVVSVATSSHRSRESSAWGVWAFALCAATAVLLFVQALGRPGWAVLLGLSTFIGLSVPNFIAVELIWRSHLNERVP